VVGTKYLSEAVHMEEIRAGALNIVCAPVGSGKTYWAVNVLAKTVSKPYKMLYLIDTVNGRQQLLKSERVKLIDPEWHMIVIRGMAFFEENEADKRIVVMTYAKFGAIVDKYPDFGNSFELILCDEIHNLPRFSAFISDNPNDKKYHKIAQARLESIIQRGKATVIGLSATPKRAAKHIRGKVNFIAVDEDVRRLETRETIPYANIDSLLDSLSPAETGIIYIVQIDRMKEIWEEVQTKGIKSTAIWSVNNAAHPMTAEQEAARQYILDNEELPPQYNLFIINASCETSINIYGHVDYIVVHCRDEETQIQVRGRYRKDLDRLHILDYNAVASVPAEFIGVKLFAKGKKKLCDTLKLRNVQGNLVKWPTVKKRLFEAGYYITEKREKDKWYAVISE